MQWPHGSVILNHIPCALRIDTAGWSINYGALWNEASTNYVLLNYYTLDIIK